MFNGLRDVGDFGQVRPSRLLSQSQSPAQCWPTDLSSLSPSPPLPTALDWAPLSALLTPCSLSYFHSFAQAVTLEKEQKMWESMLWRTEIAQVPRAAVNASTHLPSALCLWECLSAVLLVASLDIKPFLFIIWASIKGLFQPVPGMYTMPGHSFFCCFCFFYSRKAPFCFLFVCCFLQLVSHLLVSCLWGEKADQARDWAAHQRETQWRRKHNRLVIWCRCQDRSLIRLHGFCHRKDKFSNRHSYYYYYFLIMALLRYDLHITQFPYSKCTIQQCFTVEQPWSQWTSEHSHNHPPHLPQKPYIPTSSSSPLLDKHESTFCLYRLAYLDILYKGNPTLRGLCGWVFFT